MSSPRRKTGEPMEILSSSLTFLHKFIRTTVGIAATGLITLVHGQVAEGDQAGRASH